MTSVTWTAAGEYSDIRYETSGDVSGDYDRVVGYAGIIIGEPARPTVTS